MQDPLMQQGVELMLYGMGTVFVFLALLVICTTAMSNLLQRYSPPEAAPVSGSPAVAESPSQDEQLVAVISTAVHKHRSRNKQG